MAIGRRQDECGPAARYVGTLKARGVEEVATLICAWAAVNKHDVRGKKWCIDHAWQAVDDGHWWWHVYATPHEPREAGDEHDDL